MKANLGNRIKHYRKLRGMSQGDLAAAIKADKATVWRWEDGRSWPEYPVLETMAKELGIQVENLFENITGNAIEPSDKELIEMLQKRLENKPKQLSEHKQKLVDLISSSALDDEQARSYFALLNNAITHSSNRVPDSGKKKRGLS